ncbi:MAG TPA: O-antigen ligase family protein [Candidatus Sericytochromatia bacterium]|jgi:O-antigen ligase
MTFKHRLNAWVPIRPGFKPRLPLWTVTQLSVLLLPFSSLLSSLGILLVALGLWLQRFPGIVRRPVNWGFAVLSVLMLISTALAFNRMDALLGLFNFLPFFFVFAGLSEWLQTPAKLRRIAWLLVIGSVPVVAIGFGQQFFGLSGQMQLLWIVADWSIAPTGNPPGRMASIFSYANVLASYLSVTLMLSLGLWLEMFLSDQQSVVSDQWSADGGQWSVAIGQEEDAEGEAFAQNSPRLQIFLMVAVLGNAIALVLTNSRNAWAIAVFACLAYALYLGWRWLLVGVGVVVSSALGAAFAPVPGRDWLRVVVPEFFWARLTDQRYTDRPLAQLRSTQWRFAWSLTQQHPLNGWGLRNFTPLYQAQMQYFIGHPHNLLLMLAAETGIPAALLFFGLVGWIVVQGSLMLYAKMPLSDAGGRTETHDRLLYFSYLVAFVGCTLFSFLDVTLFDVRINLLGWLLLSAIAGMVYRGQGVDVGSRE